MSNPAQKPPDAPPAPAVTARLASLSPEKRAILERKLAGRHNRRVADSIRRRAPDLNRVPLSFAQEQLWFIDQVLPGAAVYNECLPIAIPFAADAEILSRVLTEAVRRHESLRTVFGFDGKVPWQMVQPPTLVVVPVYDLAAGTASFEEVATAFAAEPFDLANGPLMRALLVRTRRDASVLLVSMHHIICDQWSINLLTEEISTLYGAFAANLPSPLAEPELQYADFALWQRSTVSADAFEAHLGYWRERLRDAPAFTLPYDFSPPAERTYAGRRVPFALDLKTSRALAVLTRAEHTTMFTTLLAAFVVLLQRHTAQHDVVIGTPVLGRNRRELERVFGFFVNFVVLRSDVSGDPTFRELLARVRDTAAEALSHADVPFERVVNEVRPRRDPFRNPLFDISFQVWAQSFEAMNLAGSDEAAAAPDVSAGTAKFDLRVDLGETPAGIRGMFEYSTDLFRHSTIERVAARYATLLRGIAASPDVRVSALPFLPDEEVAMLRRFAGGTTPYPRDATIATLFEAQPRDRVALSWMGQRLTYGELNSRANRLARHLVACGLSNGDFVGVCAARSPNVVIALLAILKVGGAYVPLDPGYPNHRLQFMVSDSAMRLILADRSAITFSDRTIDLDDDSNWRERSDENLGLRGGGGDPAYLMYTSGSTGQPKGVVVPHRAVIRLVRNTNFVRLDEHEVLLQFASLSFDASTFELWGPLLSGGRVAIAPPNLPSPEALGQILREEGVTTLWLTASYFNKVIDEAPESLATVRQILTGGEALSAAHVRRALAALPGSAILNGYGPTENTTFTCTWAVPRDCDVPDSVPIGTPIANTQVFVVDGHSRLCPIGVVGELWAAGDGLALGYHNRPELTAERFVRTALAADGGGRKYRTGDLARWLEDGTLEFVGRNDGQVKVRGFRIELGEIEAVLRDAPGVRNAVVVAREDEPGERKLVAYWVPDAAVHQSIHAHSAELRHVLQRTLPEHMLPAAFVVLDELPLTANGKIDREALPRPGTERPSLATAYVAPVNDIESCLASIWSELLGIARVGVHDNFFELGGDSILSIQVVARARQYGIHTTPSQFRQHQTVAGLAQVAEMSATFVADQGVLTGDVPLTPVQYWFFDQRLAAPHHYNQSVVFDVHPDTDAELVAETLRRLAMHHDALRLRFERTSSGWRQFLDDTPGDLLMESADETVFARAQASLDLQRGPIMRAALMRGQDASRLAIVISHLAVDGVSWRVLMEDFAAGYAALASGQQPVFPPKTSSLQRWANELGGYARSDEMRAEADQWVRDLRGALPFIPADDAAGPNTFGEIRHVHCAFDRDLTQALLQDLPRRLQVQIEDALLAAVLLAYRRWSGQPNLLINMEGHGRESILPTLDLSRTVGWFTSIYPVLLRSGDFKTRLDVLRQVQDQLRSVPRRGVGFGLLRWLGDAVTRDTFAALPTPLVSFNYLGQFGSRDADAPLPERTDTDGNISPQNRRAHWIELNGQVDNGRLGMTWSYSHAIHAPASIERLGSFYSEELTALVAESRETHAAGFTPRDFPKARLQQGELNRLLARVAASNRRTSL